MRRWMILVAVFVASSLGSACEDEEVAPKYDERGCLTNYCEVARTGDPNPPQAEGCGVPGCRDVSEGCDG